MLKIKEGVSLLGLQVPMRKVLMKADKIWSDHGQELTITSGTETAQHWAGSLHFYGFALDLRTRYFDEDVKRDVGRALQRALGDEYHVLVEKTHIHTHFLGG